MPNGVFTVVTQVLAFTVVFLLGRFNFSLGWLLPFVVSSLRDFIQRKRDIQQAITHATSTMNERDVIFSRLDDIPAWVIFPDVERAEWINTMLNILWPRISDMVSKLVRDLQPKINEQAFLKNFIIKTVNLGKVTPRITGIKVYDKNVLQDDIIVDLSLSYFGDAEFGFSINGIEGGIKNIELEGTARIVLKHLIPSPPLVSGIEISFLKCPTYNFELLTALAPLDMFASGDLLRSIITSQLTSRLVHPNKIYIKLKKIETTNLMPEVEGVISCTIESVAELVGFDDMTLRTTVKLGEESATSSKFDIQDGAANVAFERKLIKYASVDNNLIISVDITNETGSVTSLKQSIDVSSLEQQGKIAGRLSLNGPGAVSMKLSWFSLSTDRKDLKNDKSSALLEVFVDSVRNIPKHFSSSIVQLKTNDEFHQTTVITASSSDLKKHFKFFLHDPKNDSLTITLVDQLTSDDIAEFVYNLQDLMARQKMQHDLQSFPLTSGNSDIEILMSLKLRALKKLK